MNPLWTLLFVLSAPRGVLSQVQLRESGPSLVKPSQTLSLTCEVSGFSLASNGVTWVRQAPGKALEWLGSACSGGAINFKPDLRSRLRITKDNSNNQVSLTLSSVTPADTATYFCGRNNDADGYGGYGCPGYDHRYGTHPWGQGLLVTVSSASTTAPK
nr:immunoglobulin gamma heavy chain [Bos taurus]